MKWNSVRSVWPPVLTLLVVLAIWHGAVRLWNVPTFLLPSPIEVAREAWHKKLELVTATGITALAAFVGFSASLCCGTVIAFAFSQSKAIRASGYPYAIFLQTVPVVAIAPLIVNWFGNGLHSVMIVSFIVSLFPIITNATTGMLSVDPDLLDLFRLQGASRWQLWMKLRLPNSVPHIVTGAKTSSGLAVIGAIVGEFFVGYGTKWMGLGYVINSSNQLLKTPEAIAAVVASTLLGLSIFGLMTALSNTVLRLWYLDRDQ